MLVLSPFALVLVMTGLPQAAAEVTPITVCPQPDGSPLLISSSDTTYRLDVDCTAGPIGPAPAITIDAMNVHLDLNGHTVSGRGICDATNSAAIAVSGSNNQIVNGTVRASYVGIAVTGTNNQLSDLTAEENCTGIALVSNENQVSFSDISRNNLRGVLVAPGPSGTANNNQITFNVIADNTLKTGSHGNGGVNLIGVNGTVIAFNSIFRNRQSGVILVFLGHADDNIVASNSITQNSRSGIWAGKGNTGNAFVNNTSLKNGEFDLVDENPNVNPCDNSWVNNVIPNVTTVGGQGQVCIH
jgi:hypothetical protein